MNRLIIIGNGFDLAHGLKTSYKDFIDWYWEKKSEELCQCKARTLTDPLCSFHLNENANESSWFSLYQSHSFFQNVLTGTKASGNEIISAFSQAPEYITIKKSIFFENICKSIEMKRWVDIEHEYYNQLKKYAFSQEEIGIFEFPLNDQLLYIQNKLIDYLKIISANNMNSLVASSRILGPIDYENEISINGQEQLKKSGEDKDFIDPERIMILDFNYTGTTEKYCISSKIEINHIHGTLDNPKSIIFGYGDELDEEYMQLRNKDENEYLKNIKAIRYLENDNYRKVLSFIESCPYQICIMGHSCGNSDRTLLHTLFEHKNCVSIKPYYYKKDDGTDNYLELVQNIYRNFTDLYKFRDRVVNKTYCETL